MYMNIYIYINIYIYVQTYHVLVCGPMSSICMYVCGCVCIVVSKS